MVSQTGALDPGDDEAGMWLNSIGTRTWKSLRA